MSAPATPVTLRIGTRTIILGTLPVDDMSADPETASILDGLGEAIEKEARQALAYAARTIQTNADIRRLLAKRPALERAARSAAFTDPTGPVVKVLRLEAGMSLRALAAAMTRSEGWLRNWEAGRPCRLYWEDISRAGEALGYGATALEMVASGLSGARNRAGERAAGRMMIDRYVLDTTPPAPQGSERYN